MKWEQTLKFEENILHRKKPFGSVSISKTLSFKSRIKSHIKLKSTLKKWFLDIKKLKVHVLWIFRNSICYLVKVIWLLLRTQSIWLGGVWFSVAKEIVSYLFTEHIFILVDTILATWITSINKDRCLPSRNSYHWGKKKDYKPEGK